MYVTEFSYQTYQGSRCIYVYDCVNGWASFSAIAANFSASEEDKFCHDYAVKASP